jgi:hypothetical protein
MARTRKYYLKNLEVKGQGPTNIITVLDTPPYGHAPTYQISLTYAIWKDKKPKDHSTIVLAQLAHQFQRR